MTISGTEKLGRINIFLSSTPLIGITVSVLGDLRPDTPVSDIVFYLILGIPPLSILLGCIAIYLDRPKKDGHYLYDRQSCGLCFPQHLPCKEKVDQLLSMSTKLPEGSPVCI